VSPWYKNLEKRDTNYTHYKKGYIQGGEGRVKVLFFLYSTSWVFVAPMVQKVQLLGFNEDIFVFRLPHNCSWIPDKRGIKEILVM
jgi:hypothetical protein